MITVLLSNLLLTKGIVQDDVAGMVSLGIGHDRVRDGDDWTGPGIAFTLLTPPRRCFFFSWVKAANARLECPRHIFGVHVKGADGSEILPLDPS